MTDTQVIRQENQKLQAALGKALGEVAELTAALLQAQTRTQELQQELELSNDASQHFLQQAADAKVLLRSDRLRAGAMCLCQCCDHGEGSDCACECHASGACSDVMAQLTAARAEIARLEAPPGPRCDQCRHWEPNGPHDGMGICHWIETSDYGPVSPSAKAFVDVESPGVSALYTAADFGCVQFEAKPLDGDR